MRPAGCQHPGTRRQIFFQLARIQRRRHDRQHEIRAMFFLLNERLCECDVAVKMPLMKLIEQNCGYAAQLRVVNHLPQQNALGDKTDLVFADVAFSKADLITDLLARVALQALTQRVRRADARRAGAVATRPPAHRQANQCLNSIWGTCVDLPEPVGADKISRRSACNRTMMSCSMS